MARLDANSSLKTNFLAFLFVIMFVPTVFSQVPSSELDLNQAADGQTILAPESIIFQIETDKRVYWPGETIRYTINIINRYRTQGCMRLKVFFPVDYEPLQGNNDPVGDYFLSNYIYNEEYTWDVADPGITLVEESTSGPNNEFLNYLVFEFQSMERLASAELQLEVRINPNLALIKSVPVRTGLMMYDCDPTAADGLGEEYSSEYSDVTIHIIGSDDIGSLFLLEKMHLAAQDTFFWNEEIEYSVMITYIGAEDLDDMDISDLLPDGAELVPNSINSPVPYTIVDNTTIVFNLGSLPPLMQAPYIIRMRIRYVDPPAEYPYTQDKVNTVNLYFSDTPELIIGTDLDTVTLVADRPDFEIIESIPQQLNCISPGHPYTFELAVKNWGADYLVSSGQVSVCLYTDPNGAAVASTVLPNDLAEGEIDTVAITWPTPQEGLNQTLYVRVNCDNAVDEMNYNNNSAEINGVNVEICDLNINIYDVGWDVNAAGRNGNCPDAVIAHFMLYDGNLHHIYNLASAGSWVSNSGTTDHGDPVAAVYPLVQEYLKNEPSLPANRDVTSYQLYEIRENEAEPLVLQIVADSDLPDINLVVDQLQSQLPNSTTSSVSQFNTDVFAALNSAIDNIGTDYRRAILLYSDGQDAENASMLDHVITKARQNDVPIFIMGYDVASTQTLQTLADSTAGLFWDGTAQDMYMFNDRLNELLHNYYVIFYTPTLPDMDGKWRQLDMVVNFNSYTAQDAGWYQMCWGDPDVQISKSAVTVSAADDSGRQHFYTDEEITYIIEVSNFGVDPVNDVVVEDILPPGFAVNEASISHEGRLLVTPDSTIADTIRWTIPQLDSMQVIELQFTASAPAANFNISELCSEIVNIARIASFSIDKDPTNNVAENILYVKMIYDPPTLSTDKAVYVPREPVQIRALMHAPCERWRLTATYENGSTEEWLGDSFFAEREAVLLEINEGFKLTGSDGEEPVDLLLEIVDACGDVMTATASVLLNADDYWHLSHNLYNAAEATENFDIIVSVSTDRNVRIKVLDISGRLVYDFENMDQLAGETRYPYPLVDQDGNKLGSGIYVVTVSSGTMQGWKKFVVVR